MHAPLGERVRETTFISLPSVLEVELRTAEPFHVEASTGAVETLLYYERVIADSP